MNETDEQVLGKEYLVDQSNGREMFFYFENPRTRAIRCSYTFKHASGRMFSTIEDDLDPARARRDAWLKRNGVR